MMIVTNCIRCENGIDQATIEVCNPISTMTGPTLQGQCLEKTMCQPLPFCLVGFQERAYHNKMPSSDKQVPCAQCVFESVEIGNQHAVIPTSCKYDEVLRIACLQVIHMRNSSLSRQSASRLPVPANALNPGRASGCGGAAAYGGRFPCRPAAGGTGRYSPG